MQSYRTRLLPRVRSSKRVGKRVKHSRGRDPKIGSPGKWRRLTESATLHALPRSLSMPSKYPMSPQRKYTPGGMLGLPIGSPPRLPIAMSRGTYDGDRSLTIPQQHSASGREAWLPRRVVAAASETVSSQAAWRMRQRVVPSIALATFSQTTCRASTPLVRDAAAPRSGPSAQTSRGWPSMPQRGVSMTRRR